MRIICLDKNRYGDIDFNNEYFIGAWCCSLGSLMDKETTIPILPYLFDDRIRLQEAYVYTLTVYENVIEILSESLNKLHNRDYSTRYYEVLLGAWALKYIQFVHERYSNIIYSIKLHPESEYIVSIEDSKIASYSDFLDKCLDNDYNASVYGRIVRLLGLNYSEWNESDISSKDINKILIRPQLKNSFSKKLAGWLTRAYWRINPRIRSIGLQSYISLRDQTKLIWMSRGHYTPFFSETNECTVDEICNDIPFSAEVRDCFAELIESNTRVDDAYTKLLLKMISKDIPKSYLECHANIENYLVRNFTGLLKHKKIKKIVTATGTRAGIFSPQFIAWSCELYSTKLYLYQHGGSYGTTVMSPMEYLDLRVADKYISWGWSILNKNNIIPACKQVGVEKIHSKKIDLNQRDIIKVVYCMNETWLHQVMYWANPIARQYIDYLKDAESLVNVLSDEPIVLSLRLVPGGSYSKVVKKYLSELHGWLQFDSGSNSLERAFCDSDIIIVDSNHTVMLEALRSGKVVLLYWNPYYNELNRLAFEHFSKLELVGVWHTTVYTVTEQLKEISRDPFAWWNEPIRKKTIEDFLLTFAKEKDLTKIAEIVS